MKCKKCGGHKPLMQPTCGLGWEITTMFDDEEDYTCKCSAVVISHYNPKEKGERICMNPKCYKNEILTTYNCSTDRPIVYLGKKCWYCHTDEFLEDKPCVKE